MATTKEYHDYVMECLNKAGEVTSRKMMGEYCLYYNGKLFGGLYDNRLLVKQTETSKKLLADCPLEYPYEGSKSLMFLVTEFENADFMKELLDGMFEDGKLISSEIIDNALSSKYWRSKDSISFFCVSGKFSIAE